MNILRHCRTSHALQGVFPVLAALVLVNALELGLLAAAPGAQAAASAAPEKSKRQIRAAGTTSRRFDAAEDPHTTALWLFDDPPQGNVTLTDAGPYHIDLRLGLAGDRAAKVGQGSLLKTTLDGTRGLVPGKFGRALHLPVGEGAGVIWPEGVWRRYGTAALSERGDEVPERCNLGYIDFTLEFWFKAYGEQMEPAVVWEIRNEGPDRPGTIDCPLGWNALLMDSGRRQFRLVSRLTPIRPGYLQSRGFSLDLPILTDASKLNDGEWHHLAFTFTARERQMRHFVDGLLQPLPGPGCFLPQMGQIVSMRIGRDINGKQELHGLIDEMRISDVVRYKAGFTLPGSFSRNHGPQAPARAVPNGPALLFAGGKAAETVNLGSSKHIFIDDALIDRMDGVTLTANPPARYDVTDFRSDRPWEPTPRFGAGIADLSGIWDDGDQLGMLYTNGGMWGGKPHAVCLATSQDGKHWSKPDLGVVAWDGSLHNNIVLRIASQGMAFRDPNPAAPASERYKYAAWNWSRGFYIFTSPDKVHWRRNETLALPFDPDGSIGIYWDDQAGLYRGYLRALIPPPKAFRAVVRVETRDIMRSWPFKLVAAPIWHTWAMPKPVSGELPFVDAGGEVYRFYSHKYPGAPDVFLAYPWRYVRNSNVRPGSFMMTSRDGVQWKVYEPPYYFASGFQFNGRKVLEALMEPALIVRGDEVWQYGTVRFTEHGGALYGGVEHEGGYFDSLLRLVQRLDGFVSLDAGAKTGTVTTKPLVFSGKSLSLNAAAKGTVRVALLDGSGNALPGYGLSDCAAIRTDSVRHVVRCKGGSNLAAVAGKTVRVQFELTNSKLYAMHFK
jgi:hypothetical protein